MAAPAEIDHDVAVVGLLAAVALDLDAARPPCRPLVVSLVARALRQQGDVRVLERRPDAEISASDLAWTSTGSRRTSGSGCSGCSAVSSSSSRTPHGAWNGW